MVRVTSASAAALAMAGLAILIGQTPQSLLREPSQSTSVEFDDSEEVVRGRLVSLDLAVLGAVANVQPPPQVELILFDDVSVVLEDQVVDRISASRSRWTADIQGSSGRAVFIITDDDRLAGNVRANSRTYQIRPVEAGVHRVTEVDVSLLPEELPPEEPEYDAQPPPDLDTSTGTPSVIDVLVLYTMDAADQVSDIELDILLIVEETNDTYDQSLIGQTLRLVHAEQTDYVEQYSTLLARSALQDPMDGKMDDVHVLRDQVGADLVSLWVAGGDCGSANIMKVVAPSFSTYAFSAVRRVCAESNFTFAHELGHNMGARHERYEDPVDGSPFAFNHGFVRADKEWGTIMAYGTECSPDCVRQGFWSNPDRTYLGDPTGVPPPSPDAADNRKTLNLTAATVAAFR